MHPPAAARVLAGIFAGAYPFMAHYSVARASAAGIALAFWLLIAAALIPALARGRLLAWLGLVAGAAVCWLLARTRRPVTLLYIAPVLVPLFLGWIFGRTLAQGRTPLIAQFIEIMHAKDAPPPQPEVWPYARRLTWTWTLFFAALATTNLLLAMLAEPDGLLLAAGVKPLATVPQYWWSLFANGIGYMLIAAFFAIEYAYRRRRFPQQPFRSFFDFMRQMSAAMPALLRRDSRS